MGKKDNEGSETSEDRRGKGGKTVGIKVKMESDVKVCEDGMKKRRDTKDCVGQRRYQKEM